MQISSIRFRNSGRKRRLSSFMAVERSSLKAGPALINLKPRRSPGHIPGPHIGSHDHHSVFKGDAMPQIILKLPPPPEPEAEGYTHPYGPFQFHPEE